MSDPEQELAFALDACPEMNGVFLRRATRMIFGTPVNLGDEYQFNEWRKSQCLEPLDENNRPFK